MRCCIERPSLSSFHTTMVSPSRATPRIHYRERIPTYKFLGFTCYWGKSRKGKWRLKYKSRSDRFAGKLKGLRLYLKKSLNEETQSVLKRVKRIVVGWINYPGIAKTNDE